MADKIWDDHSEFLGDMAEQVTKLVLSDDDDMLTAVRDYTAWLSKMCFIHAAKHCQEHTIDEQVIRHSQAPFDDDVSTQDDIKVFWAEREKQKAGTPEDSRSPY